MTFVKDRRAQELRLTVREHALTLMQNGLPRDKAIKETDMKFNLGHDYLEGVVPKFAKIPQETEKKKGRLIGKPNGGTCLA